MRAALDVCPPSERESVHFNKAYVTSIAAINKAVEFMLFMFSFALASYFKAGLTGFEKAIPELHSIPHGKIDLHIFVMAVSWLAVVIILLAYAFNVVAIISWKFKYTWEMMAIVHGTGAVIMLIITSITLDNIIYFRKIYCTNLLEHNINCSSYEGAGATSFFAVISVSFDAVLHGLKALQIYRDRSDRQRDQGAESAESAESQGERNESYEPQETNNPDTGAEKVDDTSNSNYHMSTTTRGIA